MDYSILSNEISQPQYAGMADAEIAAALNTPGATTRRHIPARDLIATAALNGAYAAIDAGAASDNAQVRGLCRSVLVILSLTDQTVNLDDPRVRQMFGALQQARVITAEQAAQIDALATVPGVSRAQALGLGDVAVSDVALARNWQEYEALIQRVQAGAGIAAGWLYQQRDAGAAVPEWAEVLERI